MKINLPALFIGILGLLFGGCATPTKMPALSKAAPVAKDSPPVYLVSVTFKNTSSDRYQPKLLVAHVEKEGAKAKADRLNFTPDKAGQQDSDDPARGNTFYMRLQTPPGRYSLVALTGLSRKFPFNGFCTAPVLADLPAEAAGFVYLGHVEATVRPRQGDEFRAGPVLPLLDQSVTGFSGGTFDIRIEDRWEVDESEYRSRFPALAQAEVRKNILPPFDRQKAQKWWEALGP